LAEAQRQLLASKKSFPFADSDCKSATRENIIKAIKQYLWIQNAGLFKREGWHPFSQQKREQSDSMQNFATAGMPSFYPLLQAT
jgi:hypothetical protein